MRQGDPPGLAVMAVASRLFRWVMACRTDPHTPSGGIWARMASQHPSVLILTPMKSAVQHRDTYFAGIERQSDDYFFFLTRCFGGGLYTMPSSFIPSGSVKYTA